MITGTLRFRPVTHPISRRAVAAALRAAAAHQRGRRLVIPACLLDQAATITARQGGVIDLAGVDLDDLADTMLPLLFPLPGLQHQWSRICQSGPRPLRYRTLRRHLTLVSVPFHLAHGDLLDLGAELVDGYAEVIPS